MAIKTSVGIAHSDADLGKPGEYSREQLDIVKGMIREIADQTSAVSVALVRQMLWRMLGADHPRAAHRVDSLGMWHTGRSADAREGITSFLEKRAPRFTGRPSKDMPAFYPWWTDADA